MKLITTLILSLALTSCKTEPNLYIVSGQSNAYNCDWSYFEGITGDTIINISKSGYLIDWLIDTYEPLADLPIKPSGIIFVHGEADSMNNIPADYYVERVEVLRKLISSNTNNGLPMYFSTVGYYDKFPDDHFNRIRNSVIKAAETNPYWSIAFNGAQHFRNQGLLLDGIHFTREGCETMMRGVADSLSPISYGFNSSLTSISN